MTFMGTLAFLSVSNDLPSSSPVVRSLLSVLGSSDASCEGLSVIDFDGGVCRAGGLSNPYLRFNNTAELVIGHVLVAACWRAQARKLDRSSTRRKEGIVMEGAATSYLPVTQICSFLVLARRRSRGRRVTRSGSASEPASICS